MIEIQDLTQAVVRELIDYKPRTGALVWRKRDVKWFKNQPSCNRWNNRYAGKPAFGYVSDGRRWGCLGNRNYLAHRIAWMHAYGVWPKTISFKNGDATDLRLSNMVDRDAAKPRPTSIKSVAPKAVAVRHVPRERIRLAA